MGIESFSTFMDRWLYDKHIGYYRYNNIGLQGDFYTSINVSKFFGAAIARYIIRLLEEEKLSLPLHIVEIGSNNANLISDIAEFLSAFSSEVFTYSYFATLERLDSMIGIQLQTFDKRITQRFNKKLAIFRDIASIRDTMNNNIFFISNEVFDSMPCDLIMQDSMLYNDNGSFLWRDISDDVASFIDRFNARGAEIPLEWEGFIKALCSIESIWVFMSFDYGDFIARDMNLRMFYKHKVYNVYEELQKGTLMEFFAKSDITYDVDFSLLRNIFTSYGAKEIFCITQAKCLVEECYILEIFEIFEKGFNANSRLRQVTNLNALINGATMGDRFKCLCTSNI